MREIGGYIELDTYAGTEYHANASALNCGRACLAYLIQSKKIRRLYLPYFICASVTDMCTKAGIPFEFYHIDKQFCPLLEKELGQDEWVYVINYYGQLSREQLSAYQKRFGRIIADNAQAFYHMPLAGMDTLYTCRKFFGVPDGAYLYTDAEELPLELDYSYDRMHFLLGRHEKSANAFYGEYVQNNDLFDNEPVKRMSKLTHNLLRALDYRAIAKRRTENFAFLHKELGELNRLKLTVPYGAFMYPFYVSRGAALRKELQKQKIYIPTLWPDVFEVCAASDLEYDMAANILPLPVDQRYQQEDLQDMLEEIKKAVHRLERME